MGTQPKILPAAIACLVGAAVLGVTASGQDQPQAPLAAQQNSATNSDSATPAATAPSQSPAKPKSTKVWTNDAISDLPNGHGVSVVGTRAPQNTKAPAKGYSPEKDPAWYHKQLEPLQAEIASLDSQIEKTKAFLAGERVADPPAPFHAYFSVAGNPQDQLKQLEAKRDKDTAKVEDLLDRARHNGIEPGALR